MVKSIRCGFYSTLLLNWLKMHLIIPYNFDSTYWNVVQWNCPRYPLRQNRIHNHQ